MIIPPASERPPRLVLRFAVYSAAALLLAGVGLLWFIRHQALAREEDEMTTRASAFAHQIEHDLQPADLQAPAAGKRLAQLDELFAAELGGGLVRAYMWSPDGTLVYSNNHAVIGRRTDEAEELRETLEGRVAHEVTELSEEQGGDERLKVLEATLPLRLGEGSQPAGGLELFYDYELVAHDVRNALVPIAVALGVAWLLLYGALFPILRQVTRALESRSRRLGEQADGYKRALEEREQAERRLGEAERNYRNLVEQLPLVTYIDRLDESVSSIYMSPQIEDMLGYPVTAWLSDPDFFAKVLAPEDRERILELHRQAYSEGRSFASEYRLVAKDGRVVWVADEVMIARDASGRPLHAQGFLVDITERKRAEERLGHQHEELQALHETALGLIDRLEVEGLLEAIMTRAGALVGTSHAYVYLADEKGERLTVRVGTGVFETHVGYSLGRGEGLAGRVWETGEPFTVDDYHAWSERRPDLAGVKFRAVAGVPLRAGPEVVGVLGVAHVEKNRVFGQAEIELLSRFGYLASVALENASLYTGLQEELEERKRAESALRESEATFRALVANLPGAIFRCAFDEDWTMEFLSDAIETILGYPASDFIHNRVRTYTSIVHPDDRAALMEAVGDGSPYDVEYRVLRADGEVRWVLERGQGVRYPDGDSWLEGVLFDITEQKSTEQQRLQLAAIVESSDDAIMSASLDGIFTSWNSGAERIFGYTADEALGQPISILTPPELEGEAFHLLEAVAGGQGRAQHELVRMRKEGTRIDVAYTFSPLRNATGELVGVSAIVHDISARKAAEAERERLLMEAEEARNELAAQNERLLELDRLKDEFIALVSHELRTPLTSIRGYVELLRDGEAGELTDGQLQFLGVVERNAHRLLHLVGDLLFLAQIEAGKLVLEMGALDLAALASESVEAGRPTAEEKDVTVTLAAGPVPLLAGDRARIAQLLDNLISNAVKFTPAGGRVDVRVRAEDGHAVLEVRDSGIGIPAAEQKNLFDRFFRSSNATAQAIQGTGLGLAISKAIVDAHGGEITVKSKEQAGTTFNVKLPVQQQAEERAQVQVAS